MSEGTNIAYFVARGSDGAVTHLVRTVQTATTLHAEYFRAGEWHVDPSAFSVADDGSMSTPIPEAEANRVIAELIKAQPAKDRLAAMRKGWDDYFLGNGPTLPKPLPAKGRVTGGGWSATFVYDDAGDRSTIEFLAEKSMEAPIHGRINADGSSETLDSYLDHFYVDPSLNETEADGRKRMQEHNNKLTRELRKKGLL